MFFIPIDIVCPGLAYHQFFRGLHSRIIFGAAWKDEVKQLDLRPTFRDTPLSHVAADKSHTHGSSAAARSAAVDTLTTIAHQTGRKPYFISMSKSDQRRGELGNRYIYMSKDMVIPMQEDVMPDDALTVLIDVDYYVDMNWFLTNHDASVVLYTLAPRSVCGKDLDAHFYFKNNVLNYIVAGGATYRHELWNYGDDHFNVGGWRLVVRWLPCFNFASLAKRVWNYLVPSNPFKEVGGWLAYIIPLVYPTFIHKTYYCERRSITDHRCLILLQQEVRLRGWGALYAHYFGVDRRPLTRLRPRVVCNGKAFNKLQVVTNDSLYYSIGVDGSHASCELEADRLDSLQSAMAIAKKTITRSTVESYFPSTNPDSRIQSAVLLDYLSHVTIDTPPERVYVTEPFHSYQHANLQSYDEDAKLPMHAFMAPILGPVPVAEICKANEEYTVKERVDKVKHTKPLRISKNTRQYMREYVSFVVGDHRQTLHPVDYEEVFERQSRPQQRAILERADADASSDPDSSIQAFQKAQVENKIGPPRNISTVAPRDKLGYAQFSYAVSDHIKSRPDLSYMSSAHTPREISNHIASMCHNASHVALSDYSKMDGRVSNLGRELWSLLVMAFFAADYHETLAYWVGRDSFRVCYTKHGVKYFQDYTMASGSMVTSLHNTNENAFTAYMAFRYSGMDPECSFRALQRCRFQGDDSFMPSMDLSKFIAAAKVMGHVVEGRTAYRDNHDYVDYLSRFYGPNVWFGDPTSVSDMKRRMWGLHATHLPMHTYEQKVQKLKEKAMSFALTDPNTPFLGLWSRITMQVLEMDARDIDPTALEGWWARFPREEQWVQDESTDQPEDWMVHLFQLQLPKYNLEEATVYLTEVPYAPDPIAALLNIPCFLTDSQLELETLPGIVITSNTSLQLAESKSESPAEAKPEGDRKQRKKRPKRNAKKRDGPDNVQANQSQLPGQERAARPKKNKGRAGKVSKPKARTNWVRKPKG